jgi:hypothetical protein
MFVTNHVLAGALIGRALGRHPAAAFAAGVVSHFVMDACPHYGDDTAEPGVMTAGFVKMARCDGCAGLAAMAVAAGLAPGWSRAAVVAGMAGAAVVDSDKPMIYFFGWNPWPKWWIRLHQRVQNQKPHRFPHEMLTGAALAALVVICVGDG